MKLRYFFLISLFALLGNMPSWCADSPFSNGQILSITDFQNTIQASSLDSSEVVEITETKIDVKKAESTKDFVNLGKHAKTVSFLNALKSISDHIELDDGEGNSWYWGLKPHNETFSAQIESEERVSNGGLLPTWGLALCGVFKNNERLYTGKKGVPKFVKSSNTKKTVKSNAEIIEFRKSAAELIKSGKLEPGDICHFCHDHTAIYAGNNKWFDASVSCANGTYEKDNDNKSYFKTFYTTLKNPDEQINYVTRLKDPSCVNIESNSTALASNEHGASNNSLCDLSDLYGKRNVTNFMKALKRISDYCEKEYEKGHGWYWSDKKNKKRFDWELATGRRISNCGIYISWGLAAIGVYTHGEAMYIGHSNKKTVKDSNGKHMKPDLGLKYYDVVYHDPNGSVSARSLLSKGKIKKGDIILYRLHVNAYAGNNKWWDAGRGTGNTKNKNGKFYFKNMLSSHGDAGAGVYYIIRLKDQS